MSLANYFENVKGVGILGTPDPEGKIDLALYARPHVIDEQAVSFIMQDRLSHRNIVANPHAAYLFREDTDGYNGLRMHRTRTVEETDPQKIETLRRKSRVADDLAASSAFLGYFKIDEVGPLVRDQAESTTPSAVGERQ